MKPLEAARRMAEPRVAHWVYGDSAADKCLYCDQNGERAVEINAPLDHATDCPWLSMPKIVAALEAASRVVSEWGHPPLCPFCGPRLQRRPGAHETCPWQAFVVAMRGDA